MEGEASREEADMKCERCEDNLWVCERHSTKPQFHNNCGAAGMPCPDCNVSTDEDDRPELPPGTTPHVDRKNGPIH